MSSEPHQNVLNCRDFSTPASNVIFAMGIVLLVAFNPGGLIYIWFAVRIRQRRNDFRVFGLLLFGANALGGFLFFCAIALGLIDFEDGFIGTPIPQWMNLAFCLILFAPHALITFWLAMPGTRAAHLRTIHSANLPGNRPAHWFWLLHCLHIPAIFFIIITGISSFRPAPVPMTRPSGSAVQWQWLNDRIRVEQWDAPVVAPSNSVQFQGKSQSGAVIDSGHLSMAGSNPNGTLTVQRGYWYEFRLFSAAVWACIGSTLSMLIEFLWRRKTQRAPGTCANCGYDLRATPDRCPECGTFVVPQRGSFIRP